MSRLRGRARNIGRRTPNAQLVHDRRINRTDEVHSADNTNLRDQVASTRANKNSVQRTRRLRANTVRQRKARQQATDAHRERNQRQMQNDRALTRASLNRREKTLVAKRMLGEMCKVFAFMNETT